jgi:hypothetical protein
MGGHQPDVLQDAEDAIAQDAEDAIARGAEDAIARTGRGRPDGHRPCAPRRTGGPR